MARRKLTCRKVLFRDVKSGNCYLTPEFVGDKSELSQFKDGDSCDKDWDEIFTEFKNVKTLDEFKKVSEQAQGYYRSYPKGTRRAFPVEDVGKDRFEESDLVIEETIVDIVEG